MLQHAMNDRHFGVHDRLTCPFCGAGVHLTRRRPHPVLGDEFELQTFACSCGHETERSINGRGEIVQA